MRFASGLVMAFVDEEKGRVTTYTFWLQLNEKPSITPGCPGSVCEHTSCKSACQRVASLDAAVWCGAGPFHMPAATSLEEMNDQLALLISLTMVC